MSTPRPNAARLPKRSFDFTYALYISTDGLEIDNMPQVRRRMAIPVLFTGLYSVVSLTGYGFSGNPALQTLLFAALALACIWPIRYRQRVFISTERGLLASRPSLLSRQQAIEVRLIDVDAFDTISQKGQYQAIIARLRNGQQIRLFETSFTNHAENEQLLRYLRDPTRAERS